MNLWKKYWCKEKPVIWLRDEDLWHYLIFCLISSLNIFKGLFKTLDISQSTFCHVHIVNMLLLIISSIAHIFLSHIMMQLFYLSFIWEVGSIVRSWLSNYIAETIYINILWILQCQMSQVEITLPKTQFHTLQYWYS